MRYIVKVKREIVEVADCNVEAESEEQAEALAEEIALESDHQERWRIQWQNPDLVIWNDFEILFTETLEQSHERSQKLREQEQQERMAEFSRRRDDMISRITSCWKDDLGYKTRMWVDNAIAHATWMAFDRGISDDEWLIEAIHRLEWHKKARREEAARKQATAKRKAGRS
jgi:hypothetical protein